MSMSCLTGDVEQGEVWCTFSAVANDGTTLEEIKFASPIEDLFRDKESRDKLLSITLKGAGGLSGPHNHYENTGHKFDMLVDSLISQWGTP